MVNRIFREPTVVVGATAYACPDLLGEIKDAMQEDTEDPNVVSADLIRAYGESDAEDRKIIDASLVRLCGYSMPTLLKSSMAEDPLLEALGIRVQGAADPKPPAS